MASTGDYLPGLSLVMASVLLFAAIEFWVGLHSHSLTLGADAGHMLSDGMSLGIALGAASLAKRSIRLNAGGRLELLAALVNGLGLLAMAVWIGREAWMHWQGPPVEILSLPMMATAVLGLLINGFNLYWLRGHSSDNLNVQGIVLHVLADTLGSVGAILASVAVLCWQWMWADTVIGCVVALIVSGSALVLIGQCLQQLCSQPPGKASLPQDLVALGWLEAGKTDLSRQIFK
jgi:cobalt-zinc-cadmium efflux system protein